MNSKPFLDSQYDPVTLSSMSLEDRMNLRQAKKMLQEGAPC